MPKLSLKLYGYLVRIDRDQVAKRSSMYHGFKYTHEVGGAGQEGRSRDWNHS